MRIQTEDFLQQSCWKWFNENYGMKKHSPRLMFYSVANELGFNVANAIAEKYKIRTDKNSPIWKVVARVYDKFKLTGFKKGVADVHLCFPNGKLVYIEFKTATGTQRPEQKEFQQQVEALGFKYYIVRSLEEFKSIVEDEL